MSLPKIETATSAKGADAIGYGWFQSDSGADESEAKGKAKKEVAPSYAGRKDGSIESFQMRFRDSKHFRAAKNESDLWRFFAVEGCTHVMHLGLGSAGKWDLEGARQAGAALSLAQRRAKIAHLAVRTDSLFTTLPKGATLPEAVQAFCEGYWLATYEFRECKSKKGDEPVPKTLTLLGISGAPQTRAIDRARAVVDAIFFARQLGDRPPNLLTPATLAKEAQRMAKEYGLKSKVMGRAELEKEKMGCLIGVGKGSAEEPKLIIVEYSGGKKSEKPYALVGKGITFDTGGISIKPAANMEEMKYDMMGAATVLATIQAAAALKVPVNIIAVVAAAENMPSSTAQKPGDIQRSRSGKTVEVTNTDAEGRLVLADALEWVQDRDPAAIVDVATLTGAVIVALGSYATGIMGNNDALLAQIKAAAATTAERVWELPLYEEYMEDMKSAHADIRNSGTRDAGSSKGGIFLKFFVDGKYPWVHCDIAGTAWHRKDLNYCPSKGASGALVRTLVQWLETAKALR